MLNLPVLCLKCGLIGVIQAQNSIKLKEMLSDAFQISKSFTPMNGGKIQVNPTENDVFIHCAKHQNFECVYSFKEFAQQISEDDKEIYNTSLSIYAGFDQGVTAEQMKSESRLKDQLNNIQQKIESDTEPKAETHKPAETLQELFEQTRKLPGTMMIRFASGEAVGVKNNETMFYNSDYPPALMDVIGSGITQLVNWSNVNLIQLDDVVIDNTKTEVKSGVEEVDEETARKQFFEQEKWRRKNAQ